MRKQSDGGSQDPERGPGLGRLGGSSKAAGSALLITSLLHKPFMTGDVLADKRNGRENAQPSPSYATPSNPLCLQFSVNCCCVHLHETDSYMLSHPSDDVSGDPIPKSEDDEGLMMLMKMRGL